MDPAVRLAARDAVTGYLLTTDPARARLLERWAGCLVAAVTLTLAGDPDAFVELPDRSASVTATTLLRYFDASAFGLGSLLTEWTETLTRSA